MLATNQSINVEGVLGQLRFKTGEALDPEDEDAIDAEISQASVCFQVPQVASDDCGCEGQGPVQDGGNHTQRHNVAV